MNRARVSHLVDTVLPSIDPTTLDMREWRCGSIFCAFGHAANDPVFQAQGLGWRHNGAGSWYPEFGGRIGAGAAALFFGIDYDMAYEWFMPASYCFDGQPALDQVIERIRADLT
jgi:hypothetical protein